MRRSGDYLEFWKFDCLYDDTGVKTHFVLQIEESDPAQSVPMEASTRKELFGRKKLHPRRDSFCNNPLQTSRDRVIFWRFWKFDCFYDDNGVKTHFVPQIEESDLSNRVPMEASSRKERFERKKLHPRRYPFCNNPRSNVWRSGDYLEVWKFDCLYDDYGVKTHLVPQIEELHLSQSVAMDASTRKERFGREKLHPQRNPFCNNPLQTSDTV